LLLDLSYSIAKRCDFVLQVFKLYSAHFFQDIELFWQFQEFAVRFVQLLYNYVQESDVVLVGFELGQFDK